MNLFKRKKNETQAGINNPASSTATMESPKSATEQATQTEVKPVEIVQSIPDPLYNKPLTPKKNAKKIKNTIVLRPSGINFEYIENPLGEVRLYYDAGFMGLGDWIPGFGKKLFVHVMYSDNDVLRAYVPPDELNNLPCNLYEAVKGCESYSKLLSSKNKLLEKIQVGLLFGIVALLAFIIFLMVSK